MNYPVFNYLTLSLTHSIGTILAYLVVSASVIVARYKPGDANIHEILEEDDINCADEQELNEMITNSQQQQINNHHTEIKQTANSSAANESADEFRDSQNSQFMTWILRNDWLHRKWRSIQELKHELATFKLKKYAPTDKLPTICTFVMVALIFIICSTGPHLVELSHDNGYYALIIFILAVMLAIAFAIIALHEQNTSGLRYKVPFVPFIPTLSILFNVVMMTNLNRLTWFRLIFWLSIGMFIYFAYGIKNSTLNPESKKVKKDYRSWGSIDSDKNPIASKTAVF